MEIRYESKRVQKIFLDYSVWNKYIGIDTARPLKKRIDHLKASPSFQKWLETRLGKPHPLTGAGEYKYYGVSVTPNVRLVLRPETDDYSFDSLSLCTVVVLKGVCDYHGGKTNWIIP
jgi:proteic killer suppression protein/toxin YoeB